MTGAQTMDEKENVKNRRQKQIYGKQKHLKLHYYTSYHYYYVIIEHYDRC